MKVTLYIGENPVVLDNVEHKAQNVSFALAGKSYVFRSQRLRDGSYILEREVADGVWQRMGCDLWRIGAGRFVRVGGVEADVAELSVAVAHVADQVALSPTAPMPGLVRQVLVKTGDLVSKGQALAVMEAMKLQITLSAGGDAKVEAVLVSEGDMVSEGAELVRLSTVNAERE